MSSRRKQKGSKIELLDLKHIKVDVIQVQHYVFSTDEQHVNPYLHE
jgi:hypothetical protein